MSLKDGKDYLYLIWKDSISRQQFIIGKLIKNGQFEFKYCGEINEAIKSGFIPLVSLPDLDKVYVSARLFPVFSSRLPDRKRKDIHRILKKYGLEEYDEYLLLKNSGARLPIDTLEFIDPILSLAQSFRRTFFIAGPGYYINCNGKVCENSFDINRGDEVVLKCEPDNPSDENAVQVLDIFGTLLGYVPRYYSAGIAELLHQNRDIKCHICSVNKSKNCNECIQVILNVN